MREILTLSDLVQCRTINFTHNDVKYSHGKHLYEKAIDIVCDELKKLFYKIDIQECRVYLMDGKLTNSSDWAYLDTPFGDCIIDIDYNLKLEKIDITYGYLSKSDSDIYYISNQSLEQAICKGSVLNPVDHLCVS